METLSALILILGALSCVSASAIVEQQRDGSIQYMTRKQALEEELANIQSVDNVQKMDEGIKHDMSNSASMLQSQSDNSDSVSVESHGVGHGPQIREPLSKLMFNKNDPIGVFFSHGEMKPASLVGPSSDISIDIVAENNVQRGQIKIIITIPMVEALQSNLESSLGDDDSHGTQTHE